MQDEGFKTCPFCNETIREEAKKCRFCGEWLTQREQSHANSDSAETPCPPPPPRSDSPVTEQDECGPVGPLTTKNTAPETLTNRTDASPPKIFYRIGIVLSTICGLLLLLVLSGVNWRRLTPVQDEALVKATSGLVIVLFIAISTASSSRKGYKLFIFSIVCAICIAIGIPYFFDARHEVQERAQESARLEAENIKSLQEYLKQGAMGDVPTFTPTGDADMVAILAATRTFLTEYLQFYRHANQKIQALRENDVFDDSVLLSQTNLNSEIQKRIAAQTIVGELASNTFSCFNDMRKDVIALPSSNEVKTNMLLGINGLSSQYQEYFAAMTKNINAEMAYLKYMSDIFDGYQYTNNADTQLKSSNLVQRIKECQIETQNVQVQMQSNAEAECAKLWQISK